MSSVDLTTPQGQRCLFCGQRPSDATWRPIHTSDMQHDLFVCVHCATDQVLPKVVADAIMNNARYHPPSRRLDVVCRLRDHFEAVLDRALWSAALSCPDGAEDEPVAAALGRSLS
jgi:hypothetical protein